jgi:uncharacterized protein YceH (UPF0502 family)
VRCGKPSCHCAAGRLHGPYAYRFWRAGGRLQKRYVRLADAAAARAEYGALRQQRRQTREAARAARAEWRALLARIRGLERGA